MDNIEKKELSKKSVFARTSLMDDPLENIKHTLDSIMPHLTKYRETRIQQYCVKKKLFVLGADLRSPTPL